MTARFPTCLVLVVCLAPTTLLARTPPPVAPNEATPAEKAWQVGQQAMDRDHFDDAIRHFRLALQLDPRLAQGHLSLAAAHLALGQDKQAVSHMAAYLQARPGHFLVRMPYAEVLLRLEQLDEAQLQLERFVADVQDHPRIAEDHLIASHTRLMEIATRLGDEYTERLNRGIGLYLLAQRRAELGGEGASGVSEELLCKAAGELTLARMQRPDEARPYWYLHGVWRRLGQQQPAVRSLRAAEQHVGLSYLTPSELRMLHVTRMGLEIEGRKR